MVSVILTLLLFGCVAAQAWLLRGLLSNVFLRVGIAYLLTGGLTVALPLVISVPASTFWAWLYLTLIWPLWLLFDLAVVPDVLLPYLFAFG